MIEKTDVATLMRDMRDLADRIIDAEGENNNGEVGRIIDMYDAADTTFKAENILLVLNAFEAERQRADVNEPVRCEGVPQHVHDMIDLKETIDELRAELAALKGDQVPVAVGTSEECSPDVYAKGVSACLVDIPKEKAEVICRGISAASGVAVDWHYIGGRVHIKAMRVTAPQKPNVLLGHIKISEVVAAVSLDQNRKWNGRVGYMAGWNACIDAAIAAGGIVKDGE